LNRIRSYAMAIINELVQPGDLITASLFKKLIDAINGLDSRLLVLESVGGAAGDPIITGLFPSGALSVGDELQVLGKNFAVPATLNTVSLDNLLVQRFNPGSSDSVLIFNIPAGLAGLPKDVVLTVGNRVGSASKTITIMPEHLVPKGRVVITDRTPSLGTIQIGGTYVYVLEVDSQTTIGETYRLEARYSNVKGTASLATWSSNTVLVDSAGSQLNSSLVKIEPTSPLVVGVKVTVPTGAVSADLVLSVKSINNDAELSRSSGLISIVVGQAPDVSDPRVSVTLRPFGSASKGKIIQVNGVDTIAVPYNGQARVSVNAAFSVAGNYAYSATISPDATGIWSAENLSPTSGIRKVDETEIIGFNLKLTSSADPSGGHPEDRFLMIKVSRTDTDGIGNFESWLKMPIRGYVAS
jgi:hypothetical protein